MRALVIDDSSTMRRLLTRLLAEAGISDVTERESGSHALEHWASDTDFSLILIDRNMPGDNGASTIRRLRAMPGGNQPMVLMVSSDGGITRIKEALDAGCNGFLPKPFTAAQLAQQLTRLNVLPLPG